mmetsp:Transcript_24146/g.57565  ORF Transcript_24146/g.57565 Transcript_24146/m.57565 type:complete len:881 (+) Transcript_24146:43-2685(+)
MQYQHQGGYQGQSPYRDGTNQGAPQQSGYQASTQGQMAGQMAQSHSNQAGMMSSPQQRPASMNQPQPMSQQGMYGSQGGGQRRGNDQEAQITDLMHQVESKRSELENMTLSVVQWKQTFKDKLQHEKLEIQRDAERAISSRAQGRDLLLERTSLRMLNLYGKIGLAVAFQNLRQHRKQVLWLQRVKELKTQCEALREEATIAGANSVAASQDFAKTEFPMRVLSSLSHLLAIAQGHETDDGGWILSDVVSVGNAVVGERLRHLLGVIQDLKNSEAALQSRTADLVQGNPVVAQLQERIQGLEMDVMSKRKTMESLSMQLDIERESQRAVPAARTSSNKSHDQTEMLGRELQMVSDAKGKLEEDNMALKRKVIEVEDSNNQLRKQLVDSRRETEASSRGSIQGPDQERRDAETAQHIQTLKSYREAAETKAQMLGEELRMQKGENTRQKEQLDSLKDQLDTVSPSAARVGSYGEQGNNRSDLLQLIQLRASAEKRAEEAETALKMEQQTVWKLREQMKMMETRLSDQATRGSGTATTEHASPKIHPRDSSSSVMSNHSTTPGSTSFELQRMQRELKVMAELKEAALQSLDSLRSEMVDGVTNIEFSHLRIDSKIGSGSFAEVYRGDWTRPCAVKKLRGLTRRRQLQDFYREAQILQMLNHNGIVQLMGICMNIPELYLVTELVVGGSLEDLLHIEKRKLTLNEILSIAMQIADAMQFLHMANIVHRDLKPSNCLIDHTGVVKLCDFGLARVMGKETAASSESARAGTPVYLAPEALQGAPTTNKVDVYSFAIICWEMITGHQAWVTLDYKQMVGAVLRDRKRPALPLELRKEWKVLIDSCWSQDPMDRPSFSSVVVSLVEMGAPKANRQSKNTPFKNVELV